MQRLLVSTVAALAVCSPPVGTAANAAQEPSSHERMQLLLAEIDELEPFGTKYLRAADRQQQGISNLPRRVGLMQQTAMLQRLAEAELRAARPAAAFELLDEVSRNVSLLTLSKRLRLTMMSRFWTGAFFLRQSMIGGCRGRDGSAKCTLPVRAEDDHFNPDSMLDVIENLTAVVNLAQPDTPEHLAGQWLLNVAYMLSGAYPDNVPRQFLIPPQFLDAPAAIEPFVDMTSQMGVDTFSSGGGVAADDFDGDGWIDVMVSSADMGANIQFLRNVGDGTFEDATYAAGLNGITGGVSLAHADYDNDGDLDVFVARGGWLGELGRHPNSLLRNNGDATFTDVALDTGIGNDRYPSTAGAWADYDRDGDLDLFVANDAGGDRGWTSQLFANRGPAGFEDVGNATGLGLPGNATGAAWGDYDADGDADLFVSIFGDANRLYRNDGGGFVDVAAEVGVAEPEFGYTAWFWDVDNDQDLDLLVNSYRTPQSAIPDIWYYTADLLGYPHPGNPPRLYLNEGGRFTDAATDFGIARVMLASGANFGDLDNDGLLDFYVATGYPGIESVVPNLMYRNRAGSAFQDITWAAGVGHLQSGQAVAFADLDNDGHQDVYARMGGLLPRDRFRDAYYRNPGLGENWLAVELRGSTSNHFGAGALVRATFRDGDDERTIMRVVGGTGSYGANPYRVHLGIGDARRVEQLEITWPADGTVEQHRRVEANQRVLLTEGGEAPITLQRGPARPE